ncbi:hypothetical protein EDD18DRAFT_1118146 [Armillaria luteobubalina]|uniref:Uncharacterized protein n=1 Tax=Armillaria luteobubalina TaxID=153913 RepID=A0AA39NWE0_9AGAR|nr:hypothetical protein EDD18DRAFT_1118146 [Armillaria luteobubalina]
MPPIRFFHAVSTLSHFDDDEDLPPKRIKTRKAKHPIAAPTVSPAVVAAPTRYHKSNVSLRDERLWGYLMLGMAEIRNLTEGSFLGVPHQSYRKFPTLDDAIATWNDAWTNQDIGYPADCHSNQSRYGPAWVMSQQRLTHMFYWLIVKGWSPGIYTVFEDALNATGVAWISSIPMSMINDLSRVGMTYMGSPGTMVITLMLLQRNGEEPTNQGEEEDEKPEFLLQPRQLYNCFLHCNTLHGNGRYQPARSTLQDEYTQKEKLMENAQTSCVFH